MDMMIKFRATSEEKQILEAGAKRAGLSLSAWLRGVSLSAAGDVGHVEGSPEPESISEEVARLTVPRDKSEGRKNTPPPRQPAFTVQKTPGSVTREVEIPQPAWKTGDRPERGPGHTLTGRPHGSVPKGGKK